MEQLQIHDQDAKVSIVIPCYNAVGFLQETLDSIARQQYRNFEVIVVDDGSTDDLYNKVIREYTNMPINFIRQDNSGVSAARNKGMEAAEGAFVVFFDADDLMAEDFLGARVSCMQHYPEVGFCCGPIETIPGRSQVEYGAARNVPLELLCYDQHAASCPSNYMIRRSVMVQYGLHYDTRLSSTADRFFLLQLDRVAKGMLLDRGIMYYRVHPDSMSQKISGKLILDNEKYLQLLEKEGLIPASLASRFYYRIHLILGLGFLRTGYRRRGLFYLARCLMNNPLRLTGYLLKKKLGRN